MPGNLHFAPRVIPPLSAILADLGQPSALQVGRVLHVHPRTVRRWIASDDAPRPVLLALFWLTRWGASAVESAAVRDAQLSAAIASCRLHQLQAAQKQNAHLLRVGEFGAANAPLVDAG